MSFLDDISGRNRRTEDAVYSIDCSIDSHLLYMKGLSYGRFIGWNLPIWNIGIHLGNPNGIVMAGKILITPKSLFRM